ncbi:hypothetical protein CA13_07960 [Planctomycetes bacterium CA13]|uniref:DUF3828 domain-containing protein n=1 Tax=Novipirellula herctigrandis TaxID=2527986 RepID=A0A5C5YX89_9BACT|nr:hypothetical protein CA13_07960 [Planctomycetes bacterium CA13]
MSRLVSISSAVVLYGVAGLFSITVGCGSSADVTDATAINTTTVAAKGPSATEVVSQFLDRVRRGGQSSGADQLLTERAKSELTRIGRSVQPIGSPDAHFEVTQARQVPSDPDAMLVQSIWTEPAGDGSKSDFEVVWAVQREAGGWRISGLAMQMDPAQPAVVIDFENGDEMAKLLASTDEPAAPEAKTPATNPAQASAAVEQPLSR